MVFACFPFSTDRSLTLADHLGISLSIIIGTCVFVISMSMCFLVVRRISLANAAKSTPTPRAQVPQPQLPALRLGSSPVGRMPSIDWASFYATSMTSNPTSHYNPTFDATGVTSNPTLHYNPVFEASSGVAAVDMVTWNTYWGANKRNVSNV